MVEPQQSPISFWTRVPEPLESSRATIYVLGADGPLGRDELLRLLYGGQVSIEVAFGATLLALLIGATLGGIAGFFGGGVDAVISRMTDLVMALPLLLVLIVLGATVGDKLVDVTVGGVFARGVVGLVLFIGAFTWFYPARIVRSQVLSLRRREFVEAATMVGAGRWRTLRTHIVPHLLPPLVAVGTLLVAANVILEAGASFLGFGIRLPTASWGSMLATAWGGDITGGASLNSPAALRLTLIPSAAIFVTVLALNQFAEGLREAFDPRGGSYR